MSTLRKIIMAVVPRKIAAEMEAESRSWMLRCPCGFERSVWDSGGLRWRAVGRPRRLMRCSRCGKVEWHMVYRSGGPGG